MYPMAPSIMGSWIELCSVRGMGPRERRRPGPLVWCSPQAPPAAPSVLKQVQASSATPWLGRGGVRVGSKGHTHQVGAVGRVARGQGHIPLRPGGRHSSRWACKSNHRLAGASPGGYSTRGERSECLQPQVRELQGPWVCAQWRHHLQPSLLEATSGRDWERGLGGDGGQSWGKGNGVVGGDGR